MVNITGMQYTCVHSKDIEGKEVKLVNMHVTIAQNIKGHCFISTVAKKIRIEYVSSCMEYTLVSISGACLKILTVETERKLASTLPMSTTENGGLL